MEKPIRSFVLLVILVGLIICPAFAQSDATAPAEQSPPEPKPAVQEPPKPLTVDSWLINTPDEIVATMSNGMQVAIKENHTNPVVAVRLYAATGSIHEGEQLGAGLSHIFEHLLHGSATPTRTEDESQLLMEKIGAISNAYTTRAHTCYYLTVPAARADVAVDLLADWIMHPLLDPDSVAREHGVVQRELEKGKDEPNRVLYYLAAENRYGRHPAAFPTIGHAPALAAVTREDLLDYYQRRYVPQNLIISIVGDIDLRKALDLVAKNFAGFSRRVLPAVVMPADIPPTSPRTRIQYKDIPHALIDWAYPTIELTHPDLYALDTLSYILTRGESSRLVKRLKSDTSLVLSISSYSATPAQYPGSFVIQARVDPAKLDLARKAIAEQLKLLIKKGVTKQELANAKRQTIAAYIVPLQTVEGQASQIATDLLATGNPHFSDKYVSEIQKVTTKQIQEVARKYLDPNKLLLTMLLPKALAPTEKIATIEKGDPDSANMFTLDNGLRVVLRPNHAVPLVSMQIYFRGGLLAETPQNSGIGKFTARASLKGTKKLSADDIEAFFDSRGGQIAAASGKNTLYYLGQVLKEDFPKALDIFAQVVIEPTFDADEMAKIRPQLLASIAALKENWHSQLSLFFRDKFFTSSPYKRLSTGFTEVIKKLAPQDLIAHHRRLAVAQNAVLAIYGDFDPAQARKLVRQYFSALPAGQKMAVAPLPPESFDSNRLAVEKTTKSVAAIMVAFPGTLLTNTEDVMALKVLDTIISGYYMPSGWMHEELRGQGLVYVVHAYEFSGLVPGYFAAYAACEPKKVNEVIEILERNFAKAAAGEFTTEELERAKGVIIAVDLINRQTNSDRAAAAALDELYGLGYEHSQTLSQRINRVTLDDVKRVGKKYLSPHHLICVTTPKPELIKYPPGE